jgi:hypothetical protein
MNSVRMIALPFGTGQNHRTTLEITLCVEVVPEIYAKFGVGLVVRGCREEGGFFCCGTESPVALHVAVI